MKWWQKNSLLLFLLLATLLKEVSWSAVIPIFQTPDEQAHFALLSDIAENKTLVLGYKNLSLEIAQAEEILGTRRDKSGNNKYTYHPDYRIFYRPGLIGLEESTIKNLPMSSRKIMVDQEAASYPPGYYLLDLPFYFLGSNLGLIDRVYLARILSIVLNVILVFLAFKVGKLLWTKGPWSYVLATLVAFMPMVSFISAGIHPDNLLNVLYLLEILFCLQTLKTGLRIKTLIFMMVIFFAGFYTKPLMALVIPVIAITILSRLPLGRIVKVFLGLAIFLTPVVIFFGPFQLRGLVPTVTPESPLAGLTIGEYGRFRLQKLLFEMWPWYWGVFKWLGVTLPPLAMKVITRLAILGIIGVGLGIIRLFKKNRFSFFLQAVGLLIFSSLSYLTYLFVWDYRLMQSIGFSQGLQGRYLFPNLIAHLALIFWGCLSVVPKSGIIVKKIIGVLLAIGMVFLNVLAFRVIMESYFDQTSWLKFISQASQYKPIIIKSPNLDFLLVLTGLVTAFYSILLIKKLLMSQELAED